MRSYQQRQSEEHQANFVNKLEAERQHEAHPFPVEWQNTAQPREGGDGMHFCTQGGVLSGLQPQHAMEQGEEWEEDLDGVNAQPGR